VSRRRLLSGAAAIPAAAVVAAAASRPGTAAAYTAAAATSASGTRLLTWLGHSCFRLEKDGFVAVIGQGDAFTVGGIKVHGHGEWHAPIHPDVTRVPPQRPLTTIAVPGCHGAG
jgi:hypothetical protein